MAGLCCLSAAEGPGQLGRGARGAAAALSIRRRPQLRPPAAIGCGAALQSRRRPMGGRERCGCWDAGAAGLSRGAARASWDPGGPGWSARVGTLTGGKPLDSRVGLEAEPLPDRPCPHWVQAGYQHPAQDRVPPWGAAPTRSRQLKFCEAKPLAKVAQRTRVSLQRRTASSVLRSTLSAIWRPQSPPETQWTVADERPGRQQGVWGEGRAEGVAVSVRRPCIFPFLVFSSCRSNLALW